MQAETDVLVVGGGPVGLMLALELQRRRVDYLAIDQRPRPEYYCKALGITPRTLEVWDQCGVVDDALRRGIFFEGVEASVDRGPFTRERVELGTMPYGFLTLAQYDTEEILRTHLARHGGAVVQGSRLAGFETRDEGFVTRIATAQREREVTCAHGTATRSSPTASSHRRRAR
jgi:2-polyprenyl-6-methoxyphenol hydroxylase-like FAD-dependent oxidoreductase